MPSDQVEQGDAPPTPAVPVPCPRRWPSRLLPLAALAGTTIALATSAFRVVASSIGETLGSESLAASRVPAFSTAVRIAEGVGPCPEVEDVEPPARTSENPPPPPLPTPARVSTPVEARPSMTRFETAWRPVPASSPKSERPPPAPAAPIGEPAAATAEADVSPPPSPMTTPSKPEARRILVRDAAGHPTVARVHGRDGDQVAVLLPDGRIGWPDGLVETDRPFVPATKDEMKPALAAEYAGFEMIETKHYLVLYQGSRSFAQASASLLESLYASLSKALNGRGVPVHEAEFPLVAVIFRTEDEFRKHKAVAPDVQAYYEILSNRIFLYEKSSRDQSAPEVSALRKPQTVAHEGTHQILQNIGVQPRLSNWPLWLVEGLAEYCASSKVGKNGAPTWSGIGQVNVIHMATIRDLDDPLSTQVPGANAPTIARDPGRPLVEYLVTRTDLSPTDYALSWALTYHLAIKRVDDFLDYIRVMSQIPPMEHRSPDDHLRTFKAAFGDKLGKLDVALGSHLRKLKQVDALPYYAVMFEQQIPGNRVRRAAMVSQSPLVIRQWIQTTTSPKGAQPRWQMLPHLSKARALLEAHQFIGE